MLCFWFWFCIEGFIVFVIGDFVLKELWEYLVLRVCMYLMFLNV